MLLVLGAGVLGYLLGHPHAPTKFEAEVAKVGSFKEEFRLSYGDAFISSRISGLKSGQNRGARAGVKRGLLEGKKRGQVAADAELSRIAAEAEAARQAEEAEAARRAAEATAIYGTDIPPDAPSTCPPGYHFPNPFTDACVPD